MKQPWITLDPVEIVGWGQIPGATIQDAATWAAYELEVCGPAVAMRNIPELDAMIANKTWRSPAALDIKLQIQRQYLSMSKGEEYALANIKNQMVHIIDKWHNPCYNMGVGQRD